MGNLDFSANADQLKELAAYMASQINVPTIGIGGGYAPIGTINFFDATTAPQDWLACDGTVYNIADYPQLADWYEAQHGSKNFYGGDGTTTFAVPDLQGEFLRGTGTNSHANQGSGANVGEHQDGTYHIKGYSDSGSSIVFPNNVTQQNVDSNVGITTHRYAQSTIVASDITSFFTSRPTNTSFLICVKAVVAGEVYSTEGRVVGTWIDGKKLYQKTIDFGALPNATIKNVSTGLSDIKVRNYFGYAYRPSDGTVFNFPIAQQTDQLVMPSIRDGGSILRIVAMGDVSTFTETYITLQYTKTTD